MLVVQMLSGVVECEAERVARLLIKSCSRKLVEWFKRKWKQWKSVRVCVREQDQCLASVQPAESGCARVNDSVAFRIDSVEGG